MIRERVVLNLTLPRPACTDAERPLPGIPRRSERFRSISLHQELAVRFLCLPINDRTSVPYSIRVDASDAAKLPLMLKSKSAAGDGAWHSAGLSLAANLR
jgi:hypothetical protein